MAAIAMAQITKKLVTAVFLLIWIISVSFVDLLENLVQKPPLYRGSALFHCFPQSRNEPIIIS
jgi:hypothetical protein